MNPEKNIIDNCENLNKESENLEFNEKCILSNFLKNNAEKPKAKKWFLAYLIFLAVIVILNIFILPSEPHFVFDKYPFFWPVFALLGGLILILLVKKIIQPIIARAEDYYRDI